MKRCLSLTATAVFSLGFLAGLGSAAAQPSFERDLDQLVEQRDEALHKSELEIYRKYKLALDDLLRKATRNGDIAAAVKVKAALGKLPASVLLGRMPPAKKEELGKFLDGTVWSIRYNSAPADEVYTVTFYKDGTMKQSEGRVSKVAFLDVRKIRLWGYDNAILNADFNEFDATDANGRGYLGVLVPES